MLFTRLQDSLVMMVVLVVNIGVCWCIFTPISSIGPLREIRMVPWYTMGSCCTVSKPVKKNIGALSRKLDWVNYLHQRAFSFEVTD